MITPSSDVYLLKVPLEINDLNQLTFTNKNTQYSYFSSLPKIPFDNFTYQRKDGIIRVPALYDDILSYNYVMYRNDNYSDKWFYAFIDKMEYVNDNVTAVSISLDTWQTWQFDLTFKPVLIDREHVNDDTVGANTLPESLELGDYVVNQSTMDFGPGTGEYYNDYWIVADVTQIENTGETQTLSYRWTDTSHPTKPMVNGVPSGCYHLLIGLTTGNPDSTIKQLTDTYDMAGLGSSIVSMYIVPKACVPYTYYGLEITGRNTTTGSFSSIIVSVPQASNTQTWVNDYTFTKKTVLNSVTPVNKKLLTWPYCYFNISNNAGMTIPFKYEDFTDTVKFSIYSALAASGSVKAVPKNYKNLGTTDICFDYSITGGKYPICSWTNDSYTNWLTQNGVNMDTKSRSMAIQGIAGLVTSTLAGAKAGGGYGALAAGVGSVIGTGVDLIGLAKEQHLAKTEANMIPDQVSGNVNCGDLLWATKNSKFTYIPMCIKPEYIACIDQFFSQFGYKCNKVKVPNITGRRNWNYVKTIGCYIEADIPQDDLAQIKSMFDRGITLWHNPATFADYSQNNDII